MLPEQRPNLFVFDNQLIDDYGKDSTRNAIYDAHVQYIASTIINAPNVKVIVAGAEQLMSVVDTDYCLNDILHSRKKMEVFDDFSKVVDLHDFYTSITMPIVISDILRDRASYGPSILVRGIDEILKQFHTMSASYEEEDAISRWIAFDKHFELLRRVSTSINVGFLPLKKKTV